MTHVSTPGYTERMNAVTDPAVARPLFGETWSNRFATLGDAFYTELAPQAVPDPHWVAWSDSCARLLGLPADAQADPLALQVLSGNAVAPRMQSLATVYSGHQFGVWAGQLGDGRALWLGELQTPSGRLEIQLKGAGLTPYSRMGDGRAVLRSSIREFLCSEAMAALGIPTTRALCITGSPLPVRRETVETAAIVTRIAPSFVRFGHFEHFSHTAGSTDDLRRLTEFVIDTQFPELRDASQPVLALLEEVSRRTAGLMADWQAVGFAHGVMNTDNMSILGLTIDYGPFGFLDAFEPMFICNHSDSQGRYAFVRQPNVAFWNLHALGQALLPLVEDSDAALAAIGVYKNAFAQALETRLRAKVGLLESRDEDRQLIDGLRTQMADDKADHTITWRRLADFDSREGARNDAIRDMFLQRDKFDAWAAAYAARLRGENSVDAERAARMNRVNPKYILRNHLAEVAIRAAQGGDFSEVGRLLKVLEQPFDEQPEHAAYADFPPDWAQSIEVSCSS
jgi:uncharacterized protein YdiU (UPF0061 family)